MSDDSGNGAEKSRAESVLKFLGLAGLQQRGRPTRAPQAPTPPSPDELRDNAIATLLLADPAGAEILIRLIRERITEANLNAHASVASHPMCTGFLGAEAALRRLLDDLNRLRGGQA